MLRNFLRLFSRFVLPRIVVIGLDVQDRHLAAVAAERRGDSLRIIGSHVVELPEAAIENGELSQPALFRERLGQLMGGLPAHIFERLKSEPIFVLSIPPHHIYTATVLFPPMADAELAEAVRLKMETSLPWPIAGMYFDWTKVSVNRSDTIGVFMAAVAKPTVDAYVSVFLEKEWLVSACEFHILSIAKFVRQDSQPFMLVSIDEDGIEFSAIVSGRVVSHYLQKIQRADEVQALLKDKIRQLIAFVEGSLGVPIQNVFVLDRIKSLTPAFTQIEQETGVPVRSFNLLPADERFLIANGAAQREYGAGEPAINLMPLEATGRYHENLFIKTFRLWTKVLVVFGATFAIASGSILALTKSQRSELSQSIGALSPSVQARFAEAQPLIDEANRFNALVAQVAQSITLRTHVGDRLNVLAREAVRAGVTISSVAFRDPTGVTLTAASPTRANAVVFSQYLEQAFSKVTIPVADIAPERNLNIHATVTF